MIYYFKPGGNGGTGANLYYSYVAELLSKEKDAKAFTNIPEFLENGMKKLKAEDVVVNTLAYAPLFHHYREIYGLRFKIVRDVQTSLHASYLLSEMLMQDFAREGDIVLFPSNFTRQLYMGLFGHIRENNSFVCYPILGSLPKIAKLKKRPKKRFKYGYLGRCTPDKNFDSVIRFAGIIKEKILVAGYSWYDASKFPENITYLGEINNEDIFDFFNEIEILLFPSTSNLESLGRVILEANHAGVPVIGACHGATPELCPNLMDVDYNSSTELVHNHALGSVDGRGFARFNAPKKGSNAFYHGHESFFMDIIRKKAKLQKRAALNQKISDFISLSALFVNSDFRHQKIFILKTIMEYLKRGDYINIGSFCHDVNEALAFIPRWTKRE